MGKKLGAGCAFSIVGIAALLAIIFWATSGPVAVADQFIEHIRQGQTNQAYDLFGTEVTKELPRDKFTDFLEKSQLKHAQSGSWSSRSVENGVGTIKGEVKLSTGDSLKLNLFLHKVAGDWKIKGIDLPKTSSASSPPTSEVQAEHEKIATAFFQLLKNKNYDQAYKSCGDLLKKDVDLAGFGAMIEKVGLGTFKDLSWTNSEPSPAGQSLNGILTQPNDEQLDIELVFQEIDGNWLIQGLNFRSRSQASLDKPGLEQAVTLSRGVLKSLATYMEQKKIEPLVALCNSGFGDKLKNDNVLDPFLEKFGDPARLMSLLNETVVFTAEPIIMDNGLLALKGRTKLNEKKEFLHFELFYTPEPKRWSLEKMDLWVRGPGDIAPEAEVTF